MAQKWIDFKLLKQQLRFEDVLRYYDIEAKPSGPDQVKCRCPFHDDKRVSLGINLSQKIWQCFGCKLSGNILDFVTRMEGLDPVETGSVRQGALIAAEIASPDLSEHSKGSKGRDTKRQTYRTQRTVLKRTSDRDSDSVVDHGAPNAPLTFELKLEANHPWIKRQKLKPETLKTFGVGYCKRGLMKSRVCFPLHNLAGELTGYGGEWASLDREEKVEPWLFPANFNLSHLLYNGERYHDQALETLVITSDFWSVLKLYEAGIPAVCIWQFALADTHIVQLDTLSVSQLVLAKTHDELPSNTTETALIGLAETHYVRVSNLDELMCETLRPMAE